MGQPGPLSTRPTRFVLDNTHCTIPTRLVLDQHA